MVFGCGGNQTGMDDYGKEGGNVAGILGMGWSPRSLVSQLGSSAQGQFSHCLQRMSNDPRSPNTYLRFGADIPGRTRFPQTELIQYGPLTPYYVNMLDISVAGSRLQIPPEHFARRPESRGGSIIDTGTSYSCIIQPAYDILERALVNYFSRYPNVTRIQKQQDFNLCYQRPIGITQGFTNLPRITFHLKGADLLLQPQAAFYVDLTRKQEYFCLAMLAESDDTVIGAYQQTNQRFIYDLNKKTLRFGPEDCSRNP